MKKEISNGTSHDQYIMNLAKDAFATVTKCTIALKMKADKEDLNKVKTRIEKIPTQEDLESFKDVTFGDMKHVAEHNLDLKK